MMTPAGRYLKILLQHYGHTNPHKMWQIAKLRAPWMDSDEVLHLIDQINAFPEKWTAKRLGRELNLTNAERRRLKLWTIRACDITPTGRKEERKMGDREYQRRKRRAASKLTRAEWLAANNLSRTKPWVAESISRRTWERRRTKLNDAGAETDAGASAGKTVIEQPNNLRHRASSEAERGWPRKSWPSGQSKAARQERAESSQKVMHQRC